MTRESHVEAATKPVPIKPLRNAEIEAHPMLDRDQQVMLKIMRNARRDITMYDFAKIALQAAATDYANAEDTNDSCFSAKRALHHAAFLFVYEALKACDLDIIKEWDGFEEMLESLQTLNHWLPL